MIVWVMGKLLEVRILNYIFIFIELASVLHHI